MPDRWGPFWGPPPSSSSRSAPTWPSIPGTEPENSFLAQQVRQDQSGRFCTTIMGKTLDRVTSLWHRRWRRWRSTFPDWRGSKLPTRPMPIVSKWNSNSNDNRQNAFLIFGIFSHRMNWTKCLNELCPEKREREKEEERERERCYGETGYLVNFKLLVGTDRRLKSLISVSALLN